MRRIRNAHKYHHPFWRYKNITIAVIGMCIAIFLSRYTPFQSLLHHLGNFGYLSAFFAGMLFVSTFTMATGVIILATLTQTLSPVEIGVIAGLGAVVGDITIFHFVKDNLGAEIEDIYDTFDRKNHLKKLFHTRYFSWMLPVLGAIIIASPLPDELGISLMGLTKVGTGKFVVLSYLLNSAGIFAVISGSRLFHA